MFSSRDLTFASSPPQCCQEGAPQVMEDSAPHMLTSATSDTWWVWRQSHFHRTYLWESSSKTVGRGAVRECVYGWWVWVSTRDLGLNSPYMSVWFCQQQCMRSCGLMKRNIKACVCCVCLCMCLQVYKNLPESYVGLWHASWSLNFPFMLLLSFPSYFLVLCFITCDYLSLPVDLSARSFTTLQYLSNTSYASVLPPLLPSCPFPLPCSSLSPWLRVSGIDCVFRARRHTGIKIMDFTLKLSKDVSWKQCCREFTNGVEVVAL